MKKISCSLILLAVVSSALLINPPKADAASNDSTSIETSEVVDYEMISDLGSLPMSTTRATIKNFVFNHFPPPVYRGGVRMAVQCIGLNQYRGFYRF